MLSLNKFVIRKSKEYEQGPLIELEGDARAQRILTSKVTGSKNMMLGICTIMPGDSHGWHTHSNGEEEINYVISGRALISWQEGNLKKEVEVSSGDVIYTPSEIPNMQMSIGDEPFKFVYVLSPPRE